MSTKSIFVLGAVALLIYLGFYFGLSAAFPRTEVGYEMALAGRVTGTFQSRRQYSFFLNGQRTPRYDFDAFSLVPAAGQPPPEDNQLSHYLRVGDLVRKASHAPVLTVQRGDSLTRWVCTPSVATP